ncbi:phage baseplate plug family protein [Aristophania vespae]|uniref:phage baseplate plug family protein n=1 Tax=Aristophania vespae TaxID=2697033 RepID=UPI0023519A2C|nr:hypothetical protein [Aristophania vespae]UMM63156.1 hypothetical protein DM15PD_01110 [Aristophania vespae]
MADTYILFQPNNDAVPPFQFQTTIAEGMVTVTIQWNCAGERWYFEIMDSSGKTLLFAPLIGSSMTSDINLIHNISASKLIYREPNQQFEITI